MKFLGLETSASLAMFLFSFDQAVSHWDKRAGSTWRALCGCFCCLVLAFVDCSAACAACGINLLFVQAKSSFATVKSPLTLAPGKICFDCEHWFVFDLSGFLLRISCYFVAPVLLFVLTSFVLAPWHHQYLLSAFFIVAQITSCFGATAIADRRRYCAFCKR